MSDDKFRVTDDPSRIVESVRGDEMTKKLAARCTARPRLKRDFDLFGPFMMGTGSRDAQKALKFSALSKSQETEPLRRFERRSR